MERKANIGFSAIIIIGIIYAILGGIFVVTGGLIYFVADGVPFIGMIFGGIGSIFLILGIIFIVMHVKKQQRSNDMLARGNYIIATIADLERNYNVRIMGKVPYVVIAKYYDSSNNVHVFRSRDLYCYPDEKIMGMQVKVYVEDDSYKHYYVDIEEILPNVIVH